MCHVLLKINFLFWNNFRCTEKLQREAGSSIVPPLVPPVLVSDLIIRAGNQSWYLASDSSPYLGHTSQFFTAGHFLFQACPHSGDHIAFNHAVFIVSSAL